MPPDDMVPFAFHGPLCVNDNCNHTPNELQAQWLVRRTRNALADVYRELVQADRIMGKTHEAHINDK